MSHISLSFVLLQFSLLCSSFSLPHDLFWDLGSCFSRDDLSQRAQISPNTASSEFDHASRRFKKTGARSTRRGQNRTRRRFKGKTAFVPSDILSSFSGKRARTLRRGFLRPLSCTEQGKRPETGEEGRSRVQILERDLVPPSSLFARQGFSFLLRPETSSEVVGDFSLRRKA